MKVSAFLFSVLIVASLAAGSCKKSGPADAVISVVDSTGKRISGALVVLRQDSIVNPTTGSQAVINEAKITDAAGQAFFSFRLEAVLIVEAQKGSLTARDFIRLEQSEQVSKTVIIR
jgi:hypothetical protein